MSEIYPWGNDLSVPDLTAVIDRLTYKPNWELTIDTEFFTAIRAKSPNSLDSRNGKERDQHCSWPFPIRGCRTEEDVLIVVRRAIQEWECHEVDEWLRIDGNLIHDPHVCRTCLLGGCRA